MFNLSTLNWQTGKSTFVEHRTFFHLYRSFHRLWIFLALMFQVLLYFHAFLLCLLWVYLAPPNDDICLLSHLLQALAIIAFNSGRINLNTFKIMLSIGPSFTIMNFIESKWLASSTDFCDQSILNSKSHHLYPIIFLLLTVSCAACIGCLDVLLMFGAYSSARGMAISRLFIRFFWCGLSSVFITYIYLWVSIWFFSTYFYLVSDQSCLYFWLFLILFINAYKISGRFCRKGITMIQIIHSISGYTFL